MSKQSPLGKMRQKLKLQTQTRTADGGGSEAVAWSTSTSIMGYIQPKSGGERLFGDQLEERITHIITIRHRRDVSHKNRLVYEYYQKGIKYTRIFNVRRTINRDSKDKFLDIMCEEGVAT